MIPRKIPLHPRSSPEYEWREGIPSRLLAPKHYPDGHRFMPVYDTLFERWGVFDWRWSTLTTFDKSEWAATCKSLKLSKLHDAMEKQKREVA